MANKIHPTAVIHPTAKIGDDNYIGAFCVIGPHAVIGSGNRFECHVSVSAPPEHRECFHTDDHKGIVIGDRNVFREYVTLNGGWKRPTVIKNDTVFLKGGHAGHDAIVEDHANIACNVILAGHVVVQHRANIGLGAVIHQRLVIGAFSMVGMGSTVTRDVVPFSKTFGSPAINMGVNTVGLRRAGVENIELISMWNSTFDGMMKMGRQTSEPVPELPPKLQAYVDSWNREREAIV